jgi:hypothetical protein
MSITIIMVIKMAEVIFDVKAKINRSVFGCYMCEICIDIIQK